MRKFASLAALLLSGCATQAPSETQQARFFSNAQQLALGVERVSLAGDCKAPDLTKAAADADVVYSVAKVIMQCSRDATSPPAEYTFCRENNRSAVALAANTRLRLADTALKRGCLEVADKQYREVLEDFVGTAYAAYRQRAQVGIDDIRAARK